MQDVHLTSLDRPELAIETDDIESVRAEARQRASVRLHPNASTVRLRPWGANGFAVLDAPTVCVLFRQWWRTVAR